MNNADYIKKVTQVFENQHFDSESIQRVEEKFLQIQELKEKLVVLCEELNQIKRFVYYRKGGVTGAPHETSNIDLTKFRLLHAAVGMTTEAVEFLEETVDGITNDNLDYVHLLEEAGDVAFYKAIAADVLNVSLDEVQAANNRKLDIRYQQKFSEGQAVNRDLAAERAALQNKG